MAYHPPYCQNTLDMFDKLKQQGLSLHEIKAKMKKSFYTIQNLDNKWLNKKMFDEGKAGISRKVSIKEPDKNYVSKDIMEEAIRNLESEAIKCKCHFKSKALLFKMNMFTHRFINKEYYL